MKIVATADIHFGHSEHLGKINSKTGLHTRLEDFLRNFDEIVRYVIDPKNDVGLFIVAGDLYKTRHPTNTQQEEFAKRLRFLQDKKVQTLILVGNHDIMVSEGSSHTAGVIGALADQKYIRVIDKPDVYTAAGIKIALMPYIYRQKLGVKTNQEALKYYHDTIREMKKTLDRSSYVGPEIFVGHQTLEGCRMPSGYIDPEQVNEVVVPQEFLQGFDFAIFGHIHEHQVVCQNPTAIYTGALERIDFSQADKKVGFVVYDTASNAFEFVDLPATDLYRIRLDLSSFEGDLTKEIIDSIDQKRVPQSILKIECRVRETDLCKVNKSAIQEITSKSKFDAGLFFDVVRIHTSRNEEINETISAYDALKKYIESRRDLNDISEEVLKRGLEVIRLCDARRK